MRGARLLQMLLLLQNRGRMTSAELAAELEVNRRTVLRDLDAMTEAGLPVISLPGAGGGIELGFDYRSQMTALTHDEAEALALLLAAPHPELATLGLMTAAKRAAGKVAEAQAAPVREIMQRASETFALQSPRSDGDDPRPAALARAVRGRRRVKLRSRTAAPLAVEPLKLEFDGDAWWLVTSNGRVPQADWGDLMISARTF